MGQGIHTGGSSQAGRHGAHHIRIHNGNFGDIVGIHTDKLALLLHICDHIVDGYLCCGTGSGGHSNGEYRVVLGGGHTLQAAHVGKLRVAGDDAYGLGSIHSRTAADGYDAVCARSLERSNTVLYILDGGIGLDVAVYLIGEGSGIQQAGHLFGDAEADQIRVGADKGLFIAAGSQLRQNIFHGALAVIGNCVQYDTVCHNDRLLYSGKPRCIIRAVRFLCYHYNNPVFRISSDRSGCLSHL